MKRILKREIVIFSLLILIIVSVLVVFLLHNFPRIGFLSIQQSHIQANVPEKTVFNQFLIRDLENYFSSKYQKKITIKYELLRDAPTQVGVAYPKYYIWITIYENGREIEQGAARVAAIDKESFDVTHYLTRDEIKQNPEAIYQIFPKEIGDKIKSRLEN